mmetsp:Transcript_47822/g.111948  ORF Transcript_47822/g.111948 Transcript_47822/m.111948 type:complete len:227 (+) Transcript_47822:97-777(+)
MPSTSSSSTSFSSLGCCRLPPLPYLMLISAALLRLKLSSTPRLITSQRTLKGQKVASPVSAMSPVRANPQVKLPVRWDCRAKMEGKSLSRAIGADTSGCGRMDSRTTRGRRINSPIREIHAATAKSFFSKTCGKSVATPGAAFRHKASWAVTDMTAAPASVPMRANGMVLAGLRACDARQQTSSNPMKPKKRRVVALMIPDNPPGMKASLDSTMSISGDTKPIVTM